MLSYISYGRLYSLYWELRAEEVSVRYASDYDFEVLRKLITENSICSIFDLGCGAGRLFALYNELGVANVIACDLSSKMIELASMKLKNFQSTKIRLVQADISRDIIDTDSIQLLISSRVLQHIPPSGMQHCLTQLVKIAPKYIFLSEIQEGVDKSKYTFSHNYQELLSPLGYEIMQRGVFGNGYAFIILRRSLNG